MIPRWVERLSVLGLLLIALWLRGLFLLDAPLGFSDAEIRDIQITEQVRQGQVRVFFEDDAGGGQESFYQTLNMVVTQFAGDGLLGYRLLSLWASLIALAFLYIAARHLFGVGIALVALAIMTTGVDTLLVARSATPITLTPLFASGTLALMVWTFRLHEQPMRPFFPHTLRFTLLGVMIGAAVYNHYSGLMLILILLAFVAYLWATRQPVTPMVWSSSLFAITLILVIMLPYLISILRDPDRSSVYVLWRNRPADLLALGESFVATLGAFFIRGDQNPIYNVPGLPLFLPFWSVLVVVGLVVAIQRWRNPVYGLLLITLVIGLLPDIWLQDGPDFTALTLVQPVTVILAGLGAYIAAVYIQDNRVPGGWRLVAVLVGVGYVWTLWQGYQRVLVEWKDRADVQEAFHTDLGRLTLYLDLNPDSLPTLICVSAVRERVLPDGQVAAARPDVARYMLHREGLNIRFANCRNAFVFVNGGAPMQILWENPGHLAEVSPQIDRWLDQAAPLEIAGLPNGVAFRLESARAIAALGGQLQRESLLYYPRTGSEPEPAILPVRFGRNVTLLGYQADFVPVYRPGEALALTSYWRIEGEPPSRMGIFMRLHDSPQTSPFTEVNVLDVIVDGLRDRDVIIQSSAMNIPLNLLPGEYVITLGVYDNNPLNQITVFDATATQSRGTYLALGNRVNIEATNAEN